MRVLGIDLGSREVKVAVMQEGLIVKRFKTSTMTFYRDFCIYKGKIIVDVDKLEVDYADIKISTGYRRNNTDLEEFRAINEIKAHVYGAMYQTGMKEFILLDIGGQDVKVVKVEKGMIIDIELNEKCAASCGRYLENMANVLEISVEEMAKKTKGPVELNSTCAVFSESELIGKIAEGYNIENLCAGVNYSMYKRLRPLLARFAGRQIIISGGAAKNVALTTYLKNDYDEVIVLKEPQFNGAYGCCHYGERMHLIKRSRGTRLLSNDLKDFK